MSFLLPYLPVKLFYGGKLVCLEKKMPYRMNDVCLPPAVLFISLNYLCKLKYLI